MFGLSFLNSGVLSLLLVSVVPLLIYLFIKKKPQKIIFSSIRFIKESQKKQKQKININNLLLLIIRTLILLLVIFALARPSVNLPFLLSRSVHPPTAVAIIIDTSYSMDYLVDTRTELEIAIGISKDINSMLTDNDVSIVMTSDEKWNNLNSFLYFGEIPERVFDSIDITPTPLSYSNLIEKASQLLYESQIQNREIYIVSDFMKQDVEVNTEIPIFLIPTSDIEERINVSVQNARIAEEFVNRRDQKKISFDIVNHSSISQQDVICQLVLNNITVAEKAVTLNPFQRRQEQFIFELEPTDNNWYYGYVEVLHERMKYDTKNYFSFKYEFNPTVAVLTNQPRLPLVLESVLEIYVNDSNDIYLINEGLNTIDTLLHHDFIIVYDYDYSQRNIFILQQLKELGKKIIYISNKSLSEDWKSFFSLEYDLHFTRYIEPDTDEKFFIDYVNIYHPITYLIDVEHIRRHEFTDFWGVESESSQSNILISANNRVILLEHGNAIFWFFDVRSLKNYFLVDYTFPLIAYRSFLYSAELLKSSYHVGDVKRTVYDILVTPDKNEISISSNRVNLGFPGIYEFYREDSEKFISVNIIYDNSDYQRIDKKLPGKLSFLDENWQEKILRGDRGSEIWKYLFLLVLLLFLAEMFIVKKSEKQSL